MCVFFVGKSKSQRGKASPKTSQASRPPPLQLTHNVKNVTIRFGVTSSGSYTISNDGIYGALGTIGITLNTFVKAWASTYRLRKVTVFPSSSASSDTTCSLNWSSGLTTFAKDEVMNQSVPSGMTVPEKVVFVPPKKSLVSDWIFLASVLNMFSITVSAGSIVDLNIDYTLGNSLTGPFVSVTTAVVGTVYYLALDGPSSNKIVPIGLPTTS